MYLTQDFLMSLGIDVKKFRFRKHGVDEIAHYAQECWDAELYSERFGWVECVGIADRSAYDLNAHINASGTDMYAMRKYATPKEEMKNRVVPNMSVLGPLFKQKARRLKEQLEKYEPIELKKVIITLDGERIEIPENGYTIISRKEKNIGKKFIPHVIEPSFGIDRIIYCLLEHSYQEQKKKDENYRILQLNQEIAPIKVGVFPLINDKKLILLAKKINDMLRNAYIYTYYDESGSIGRRYARMDEIGTPFCITVDFESLEDAQITIRERDTTKQVRQPVDTLISYFKQKFYF
jgi:glycyl-tRNA synthetase